MSLVFAAGAAHADCRDDLSRLQREIAASDDPNAPNVLAAQKELAKAQDPSAGEADCDNALDRARQALEAEPLPDDAGAQPQDDAGAPPQDGAEPNPDDNR